MNGFQCFKETGENASLERSVPEAGDAAETKGAWEAYDEIDQAMIPDDLQQLFDKNKKAFGNYQDFPPSSKRIILDWITNAKRPETRRKRIEETVKLAARNIRLTITRTNFRLIQNQFRVCL